MEPDDLIEQEELRKSMDAEVKRVSDLFRFILKYKRQFQPSGVEFSGLRQYLPSDDASRIDWKISAGKPDLFVKQYDEEIDMDIFIVFDASDTMLFGTSDKLKSEYAAIVAAALSYASIEAGINAGIGIWGGEGDPTILTPEGGEDQYQRVLNEVTTYDNYGGTFNIEETLTDVVGQIKDNTAIFIISDFLEVEGEWKAKMQLASNKFRHVLSVMVKDRRDYKLPETGNMRFESPHGEQMVVNTAKIAEDFNREAKKQEEKMQDKIEGGGSSFLKLDTRDNFSAKFAEYFDGAEGGW